MSLEEAKKRAFMYYRNHKRYLARIEKKFIESPTPALQLECRERRGILRGIMLCWDAIEGRMNDNEFAELGNEQASDRQY